MFVTFLQSAILGAVQGLTEFLPISSTAHLAILTRFFGLDPHNFGLNFDVFTALGTTIALVWYFWGDIKSQLVKLRFPTKSRPLTQDEHYPWHIAGITFLVGIAGLLLQSKAETSFRNLTVIASMLILFGLIMLLAEWYTSKINHTTDIEHPGIIYPVGLAQILAFIPGVSRSGVTISTGMFASLKRADAARLSFLLSVPITVIVVLKQLFSSLKQLFTGGLQLEVGLSYLIAAACAGVFGYLSIKYLMKFLSQHKLNIFAYYRIVLGLALMLYLLIYS